MRKTSVLVIGLALNVVENRIETPMDKKTAPKELRKPKLSSIVLEISLKNGAPLRQPDKLRLRRILRLIAKDADER